MVAAEATSEGPVGVSALRRRSSPTVTARWAKREGVPVARGHEAGAEVVKARLKDAVASGIRELTVYSFSTENWKPFAGRGRGP